MTSWDVCRRSNKKFVKTNDLKPYLTTVSGVDKLWVRGIWIPRATRTEL